MGAPSRAGAPPAHRRHADVQHRLAIFAPFPTSQRLAAANQIRPATRRRHLRVPSLYPSAPHLHRPAHRRRYFFLFFSFSFIFAHPSIDRNNLNLKPFCRERDRNKYFSFLPSIGFADEKEKKKRWNGPGLPINYDRDCYVLSVTREMTGRLS